MMKRRLLASGLVFGMVPVNIEVLLPSIQRANAERKAIQNVVQTAYIDGIQNYGDIESIRKDFQAGFNLLMKRGDAMNKRSIEEWIQNN